MRPSKGRIKSGSEESYKKGEQNPKAIHAYCSMGKVDLIKGT